MDGRDLTFLDGVAINLLSLSNEDLREVHSAICHYRAIEEKKVKVEEWIRESIEESEGEK